jgi:hypothetical protein
MHRIGPTVRPPYTQQQRSGAVAFAIVVVIAILFSR